MNLYSMRKAYVKKQMQNLYRFGMVYVEIVKTYIASQGLKIEEIFDLMTNTERRESFVYDSMKSIPHAYRPSMDTMFNEYVNQVSLKIYDDFKTTMEKLSD